MSKILVVDDDAQINLLLKEYLSRNGFEVDTASNGVEAKKLYSSNTYDVFITDIIMPEKDGFEVILELRHMGCAQKTIAISGGGRTSAEDYLVTAEHFDVAATFSKPLDLPALLLKVKELVGSN